MTEQLQKITTECDTCDGTKTQYACEDIWIPCPGCHNDYKRSTVQTTKEVKPRIQHFYEARNQRVVTIAYRWHRSGKVEYGATIWHADTPKDTFTKKMRAASNKTALSRLDKNPVVFFVTPGQTTGPDVVRQIRDVMKHMGVRGYSRETITTENGVKNGVHEFVDDTPVVAFKEAYTNVVKSHTNLQEKFGTLGKKIRIRFHSTEDFKDKEGQQKYVYRVCACPT